MFLGFSLHFRPSETSFHSYGVLNAHNGHDTDLKYRKSTRWGNSNDWPLRIENYYIFEWLHSKFSHKIGTCSNSSNEVTLIENSNFSSCKPRIEFAGFQFYTNFGATHALANISACRHAAPLDRNRRARGGIWHERMFIQLPNLWW